MRSSLKTFGHHPLSILPLKHLNPYPHRMDISVTDTDVEKMTTRLVSETRDILNQHNALLRDLSIELCLKGSMEAKEVAAVAKRHKLNVLVKEEDYLHIAKYMEKLKKK